MEIKTKHIGPNGVERHAQFPANAGCRRQAQGLTGAKT